MNTLSQIPFILLKKFVNKKLIYIGLCVNVDSLFTNIPLEKTIDICVDSLYNDHENTPKIPKDIFRNLLNVATKESFFMFNNKFFQQIDSAPMGSPLSSALGNIFMRSFENKWLKDCPLGLKPVFYRRYVDDIFTLFSSLDHAESSKRKKMIVVYFF